MDRKYIKLTSIVVVEGMSLAPLSFNNFNVGDIVTSKRNMKTANEIHLKYVDDLSLAEAISIPDQLVSLADDQRPLPDSFHARTGHVLPMGNSKVYRQLMKTKEFAEKNNMKLNYEKTKLIVFNPCTKTDFQPSISIDDHDLEVVEEIRLLGITIRSDMKWISNTSNMISKAGRRLWMLRRLKNLGANEKDLVDVYLKQIRCVMELAVPAWQSAISQAERQDLERIQKSACHIILGRNYTSYKHALKLLKLDTLESRRIKLSLKFGLKAENHKKFKNWFKPSEVNHKTRSINPKYCSVRANHTRFAKSPLSYLTKLLNTYHSK